MVYYKCCLAGSVESTESTYKYHMQVQAEPEQQTSLNRQGPLKNNLKPTKRRTMSGSSTHSATSLGNVSLDKQTTLVALPSEEPPMTPPQPQQVEEVAQQVEEVAQEVTESPQDTAEQ